MAAFEEETMRLCCASIFVLLLTCTCVAQQHVPQTEVTISREQVNREQQNQPYQGRPIASLQFRGNQHFSSETIRDFMKTKEGDAYDLERATDEILRRRLRIHEGDVYNEPLFNKSVERIFALGLYEEVSLLDQIDDQRNYVDITIRVKEKEHEQAA
jgi:outer membrane protein assembly factor BamA